MAAAGVYRVAVTGLGLATPLGSSADQTWQAIESQRSAARPLPGNLSHLACPVWAVVTDDRLESEVADPKSLRLMNRDALLAAAAARRALQDAVLTIGRDYPSEQVALYGATGLAGAPLGEVARLVRLAAGPDGSLDLDRLGGQALKQVRPVLSFKILSNMPLCFVSIFEHIQGPNGIFNPWEGQGAWAIARGMQSIARGEARCAVVGGCDVKTHHLGLIALRQQGVLDSWQATGQGSVPGEGAVFLVLEEEASARARGARIYARLCASAAAPVVDRTTRAQTYGRILAALATKTSMRLCQTAWLSAADGDAELDRAHQQAWEMINHRGPLLPSPRRFAGNLLAAAAALQVAMASWWVARGSAGQPVVAPCFGHGPQQAVFLLEAP